MIPNLLLAKSTLNTRPREKRCQAKVKEMLGQFDTATITQVPIAENMNANTLARLATGLEESLLKMVPIEVLESPSIDKPEQVGHISARPRWMDPIVFYLCD